MKFSDFTLIEWLMAACVVAIVGAVGYGIVESRACAADTLEECLAGGEKNYICKNLVQQNCYPDDDW